MERTHHVPMLLVLVGLGSAVATLAAGIQGSNIDGLVTAFTLTIDGGLILMGVLWLSHPKSALHTRIPAVTVLLLGVGSIVGGVTAFEAWKVSFNQELRVILTGVLVLVGCGLVISGWLWTHRQQVQHPTALLISGLIPGLAYIAHQRLDLYFSTPLIVLTVVLSFLFAIVAGYVLPPPSLKSSA